MEAAAEAVAAVTPLTSTQMRAAFSVLFSRFVLANTTMIDCSLSRGTCDVGGGCRLVMSDFAATDFPLPI